MSGPLALDGQEPLAHSAPRRHPDPGLEVHVRVEPRARRADRASLGIDERDFHRELARLRPSSTSPTIRPASRTSARAGSSDRSSSAGACTTTWVTSVRIERFASLFALRISPRTAAAAGYTVTSPDAGRPSSSVAGHGAVHRSVAPPRPHLFGHERHVRREQSQQRVERERQAPRPMRRHPTAVGAALDQLEVVVAEAPEEPLGPLERARVVVALERRRRVVDQRGEAREHRAVERFGDAPSAATSSPITPSANFDALRILIARRRPTFI